MTYIWPPGNYRPLLLSVLITSTLGLSACGGSDSSSDTVTPVATPTPSATPMPTATPTPAPGVTATPTPAATSATNTNTNTAPVANAGVDKSAVVGSAVTLDASASSDVDNDSLSYTWSTVTLPSGSMAVLSSSSTIKPTFTPDLAGAYTFQLVVRDSAAASSDQVTITASAATGTASTTGSTLGVLCDYNDSTFNDSAAVNATSTSSWSCSSTTRDITANGLPDHAVGTFPNAGNPNEIAQQAVSDSFTLTPETSTTATTLGGPAGVTGYVLNGVKIDAGTAGSCDSSGASCSLIDNSGGWSIEALGQSHFNFGTDDNNAHVQPGGAYHYHGMPEGFVSKRGGNSSTMTLIGWAADGFPIYARYGYSDANDAGSTLKNMQGSYRLVSNVSSSRPATSTYALGTFSQDWEYVAGSGDLDECNGRTGVTPEFPNGIYHYFATDSYPYFQRCVKGVVESNGTGGPPPGGGAGGPPPR